MSSLESNHKPASSVIQKWLDWMDDPDVSLSRHPLIRPDF
jgi:hypothetical protein